MENCFFKPLLIKLLYGTRLRLTEGPSLRVKDVDFAQNQIIVRDTKGNESRVTMLPESIAEKLKIHLQSVKIIHQQDLQKDWHIFCMNLKHLKWYKVNTLARGITHPTHISKIKYES